MLDRGQGLAAPGRRRQRVPRLLRRHPDGLGRPRQRPRSTPRSRRRSTASAHVSTLYPTLPIVELAERLARITPGKLEEVLLHRLGHRGRRDRGHAGAGLHRARPRSSRCATATRAARLLAQSLTGARDLARAADAGRRASSTRSRRTATAARSSSTYPSCGVACAKDIEELIRTTTTGRIAGFLAEPIQGVGGFITPPPEYFEIAVDIVRKYGGVFICDEVQTGFGRTGGKMCGIEHWGVEPDIMTMAKGIANGMPLGVDDRDAGDRRRASRR